VTIYRPSPDAPVFSAEVYSADVPEYIGAGSFTVCPQIIMQCCSYTVLQVPQFVVSVRADDPAHDTLNTITFHMETRKSSAKNMCWYII